MPAARPRDAFIKLLAIGVALLGLVSIISALTPDLAARSDLLHGVMPVQATRTAHVLVFEVGLLLMVVAFGLVRRRHRAWQLAVALLAVDAALHIAKGLDVEEAVLALVLLVLLVVKRSAFTVEGAHDATRRTLTWVAGLAAGGLLLAVASAEFVARRAGDPISLREAADRGLEALVGAPDSYSALGLYTAIAVALVVILWLRPVPPPEPAADHERDAVRSILNRFAVDGLSYFALRRDTTYAISRAEDAFLAYRVVANVALVAGSAVGPEASCTELVRDFHEEQIRLGRRIAVIGLPGAARRLWEQAGLTTTYLGDEAIVNPQEFSLEGRPMRKVRQSVNRLERDGYSVVVRRRRELDPLLLEQLRTVSDAWLGGQGERGFSMALDDPWAAEHTECVFAIALGPDGAPAGYIHFVPVLATGDLSLSTMRRREDTPNGLNEAILSGAFAWARAQGIERVGLNFSAFGRILRAPELQGWERLAAQALLQGDRWFQLERLDAFNRKFLPTWEPRFAAYERTVDLPQAALAILAAEGLLPVPKLPTFGGDPEPAR
ncbi:MAG: bifunctional lysylphosphatidylglycerol flippase/synthetase MprF [Gaiellales bacterium]